MFVSTPGEIETQETWTRDQGSSWHLTLGKRISNYSTSCDKIQGIYGARSASATCTHNDISILASRIHGNYFKLSHSLQPARSLARNAPGTRSFYPSSSSESSGTVRSDHRHIASATSLSLESRSHFPCCAHSKFPAMLHQR